VAGYVRVSGTAGQETSLEAQEAELRARYGARLVGIYRDRGSGLNDRRRGLQRMLSHAEDGRFTVVAVTHRDRLARVGVGWIEQLLRRDGVRVEAVYDKGAGGDMAELLEDFMSLVATFAWRMYGIRSAEAKRRLLAEADARV
jgi:predicted site-specific integrase-resolvase